MNTLDKTQKALPYALRISVFKMIISLIGMLLLVRYFDAEIYGVLALFMALPSLVNLFISFGFIDYVKRYTPQLDDSEIADTIWPIIIKRVIYTTLLAGLLIVTFEIYSTYFGLNEYKNEFYIFQIGVISFVGYNYFSITFSARFLHKYVLYITIIHNVLRTSLFFLGIVLEKQLLFFIYIIVFSHLASFTIAFTLFSNKFGRLKISRIFNFTSYTKDENSYRRNSYINQIGTSFLGTDIDRYILAYFSTNIQVAIYAVATNILKKLIFFLPNQMLRPLIEPAVYSRYDQKQKDLELFKVFQLVYNINNYVIFLFLAIFIPLGTELLKIIFKHEYIENVYWPLIIFLIFLMLYAFPLSLIVNAIKKPKILIYSKITIFMNVGIGIPLAYYYGAVGMSLATVISIIFKNMIIYFYVKKNILIRIPVIETIKSIFNMVATVVFIYGINNLYKIPIIIDLALVLVLYIVLNKTISIFSSEQRRILLNILPDKYSKFTHYVI
jgi:O-antigen/teichoic acid export membrane protein